MSDDKVLYLSFLCAATSLVLIWRWGRGETAGRRFPPGPRGLPLLGNVLDLSKDVPIWQTFQSMAQDYRMHLGPTFPDLTELAYSQTQMCYISGY